MFIFFINKGFNINNMSLGTYKGDTPGHTNSGKNINRKQYYMKIVYFQKNY